MINSWDRGNEPPAPDAGGLPYNIWTGQGLFLGPNGQPLHPAGGIGGGNPWAGGGTTGGIKPGVGTNPDGTLPSHPISGLPTQAPNIAPHSSALLDWLKANGIGLGTTINNVTNGGNDDGGAMDWLKNLIKNPAALLAGGAGLAEILGAIGQSKKSDNDIPEMRALLDLQRQKMLRVDPVKQSIELLASKMLPTYAREGIPAYQPAPLTYDPTRYTTPQK